MTGVVVNNSTSRAARGPVTPTQTMFLVGPAASTATGRLEITSMADFVGGFGGRVGATQPSWDAVDVFFREGGKRIVYGPYAADFGDGLALLNDKRLGPGQLVVVGAAPGQTLYADMRTACQDNNRVAIRDVGDAVNIVAMENNGDLAVEGDDLGATFGPWVIVPPPLGVSGGSDRVVPASPVIAALCSRVDGVSSNPNPNRAAAGQDFALRYVADFVIDVDDASRETLFAHGVNCFKDDDGLLVNYGFQTNISDDPTNPYWQFNASRGRMYLTERARVRGGPYMFRPIDGRGRLAGALQGDLEEELKNLYDADALYGDKPSDAYEVSVVEVASEVAQGELHATADVTWTMHTKTVEIDLLTVPIGQPFGG